jgi:hypothetical protein
MTTIQPFDFHTNPMQALLWQYNDAARLQSLVQSKQDWYNANQTAFWQGFYNDIYNIKTANEFGRRVWAIILGINLFVENTASPLDFPAFGFENSENFDNGTFATDGNTTNISDDVQRIALLLRCYQIQSAGTVPEINRMLKDVFGHLGKAYLLDGLNMAQVYVFNFPMTADLRYLLDNYDILPRPAGVDSTYYIAGEQVFGFDEYNQNFDNATFGA